jgi:hypothetical protein
MSILLKTIDKTYRVSTDKLTTAQDLLELINAEHWTRYQDFSLVLNGSVLNKSAPISPETVILVVPAADEIDYFDLIVEYYGRVITFQCSSSTSGAGVKARLLYRAFLKVDAMRLWHHGTEMNDSELLKDVFTGEEEKKLVLESLEHVEVKDGIEVRIRTLDGRNIPLEVTTDMLVDQLKSLIAEKIQTLREDIKLVAQGRCMFEGTISDRHVIDSCTTIYVVLRLRPY